MPRADRIFLPRQVPKGTLIYVIDCNVTLRANGFIPTLRYG
jgi:hypothetical protein